jgi:hypothetical protein
VFLDNKSTRIYRSIIANAIAKNRSRSDGVYYERHHIQPRSLGGTDDAHNLVLLTPKEHYVCHRLLVKMVEGKSRSKMYAALKFLQSKHNHLELGYYSSRKYQRDRIASRVTGPDHHCYGKPVPDSRRQRMLSLTGEKALFFGRKHTSETKDRMSKAHKGKMLGSDNPMFQRNFTEEHRRKIGDAGRGPKNAFYGIGCVGPNGERYSGERHGMFGKKHSEETRAKIRTAVAGKQLGHFNHRYGRVVPGDEREQQRQRMNGRKWINDGERQRFLSPQEALNLVNNGWKYGRIR